MIVLTEPLPGAEDDFNNFQTNEHVPDLLRVPGVVGAQRYLLSDTQPTFASRIPPHPYLCIYEIEADSIGDVTTALERARASGSWQPTRSTSPDRICAIYSAISEPVAATDPSAAPAGDTHDSVR